MRYWVFVFLCLLSVASKGQHFQFSIDDKSVGLIADAKGKVLGTGFVFEEPRTVVTCAHVAKSEGLLFVSAYDKKRYRLTLQSKLTGEDIAVLIAEDTICRRPLGMGSPESITPGDPVVYIGFDAGKSDSTGIKLVVHSTDVSACGKALNHATLVGFFEFQGEGRPGYSGGPVFDKSGKVVGIMREAWIKQGLKGSEQVLINRAFSISPLAHLTTKH